QVGSPELIFEHPANLFVAKFIGSPTMNILPCHYDGQFYLGGQALDLPVPDRLRPALEAARGRDLLLGIRPQALRVVRADEDGPGLRVTVDLCEYLGTETVVSGRLGAAPEVQVTAVLPARAGLGGEVRLKAEADGVHVFDAQTELALPVRAAP
ncbi:MAG: TOBE domain-containing protein, partial [Paracoccaceae bacterium]|nr:TOBE domain-containing protein [Paracoccaceae bacterium]